MFLNLEQASELIKKDGLVHYKTETFWGIAANPFSSNALDLLLRLKERDIGQGVTLICSDEARAYSVMKFLDSEHELKVKTLCASFWPGPLTIVCDINNEFKSLVCSELLAANGTVGIRVSGKKQSRDLALLSGGFVTATSSNSKGKAPARTKEEVLSYFPDAKVLEDIESSQINKLEELNSDLPSTILDISKKQFYILREGVISKQLLSNYL